MAITDTDSNIGTNSTIGTNSKTDTDTSVLRSEIERLQSGLSAVVARMRELTGEFPNGYDTAVASVERMWGEVKRQAQQVGHEIEERPLVSALTAFGVGVAIGALFGGRRS